MAKRAESGGRGRPSDRGGRGRPSDRGGRGAVRAGGGASAAPAIQSFADALAYLHDRTNYERAKPGTEEYRLDRMRALLRALGHPQRGLRCVHVAGSKGKGSTVEMVASALTACGLATGLYTSPHLVHLRERVRIDGRCVSDEQFTALMGRLAAAGAGVERRHGRLTFFEVLTTLALLHFAEQAVDIAVMETGLGGRLDCTNLVEPEVTAITAIQLEHTRVLGDTLPAIAREKAGIFKRGVPAIVAPQGEEVLAVFREVAGRVRAPLAVLGRDVEFSQRFEAVRGLGPRACVSVATADAAFDHVVCPLAGEHQGVNCALALAILDGLRRRGLGVDPAKALEGLARTPAAGRMEMVCHHPRVLVDGAHTPDSIRCLVRAIGATLRYESLVAVFGCAADKDVAGMLAALALGADKVVFTRASDNPRAASPGDLLRRFAEASPTKMAQAAPDVPSALKSAARAAGRDDLICVTGSYYVAGEAKKHLADLAAERAARGKGPTRPARA